MQCDVDEIGERLDAWRFGALLELLLRGLYGGLEF